MRLNLADRLKLAMTGPPKVTSAALARACDIKPPSVSNWLSGKSKAMEGRHLIAAARLLKVRADWLANGVGPMREPEALRATEVESNSLTLPVDPAVRAAYLLQNLPQAAMPEAVAFLEYLSDKHKRTPGAVDHPVQKAA